MSLESRFTELVRAGFAGVYLTTAEPDEAISSLTRLAEVQQWNLATWDIDVGLLGNSLAVSAQDPLTAVRVAGTLPRSNGTAILVLCNFHRFLGSAEVVQAIQRQLARGKSEGTVLVILSPIVNLPPELERSYVVINHDLPTVDELQKIASDLNEASDNPSSTQESTTRAVESAAGLTRVEAENSFALSLVRHGNLDPETIWEFKAHALTKGGLVKLHRSQEGFDSLGGLEGVKTFCRRLLTRTSNQTELQKGIMLFGVPGTGKSAFAKALGRETGRPTLALDLGSLLGSLVGQTEQNVRRALATVEAMSPCICFVDEVEKGLAGAKGTQGDGGVSARLFGSVLTWLNDRTSDVFFIATSNDVSCLPPEFTRAERFDAVFFLDLPSRSQKDVVWSMYGQKFGVDVSKLPCDDLWTPAEVRACCRLSKLLDVGIAEAAEHIVPVASTGAESIDKLRQWASGRCLDAETGTIFRSKKATSPSTRRSVSLN